MSDFYYYKGEKHVPIPRRTHALLDAILSKTGIRTDAALERKLNVGQSAIAKIRGGGQVSAEMILKIYDLVSEWSIEHIRSLIKS